VYWMLCHLTSFLGEDVLGDKMLHSVKLIVPMLCFQLYPQGVWFLFFKGRLEFMKGNIDEAINWYIKSWKSQDIWPQYHHICFWELMWTNRYANIISTNSE
jgi:hypothetical protein